MHRVASDLNKAKREPFFDVMVADCDHRGFPKGDSLQKYILKWLSAPDPWKNHYAACKSRHPGTAEWFIHGNTFPEWTASDVPGSLLWVHGIGLLLEIPSFCSPTDTYFVFAAGAGKSVFWFVKSLYFLLGKLIAFISSTIIEDIRVMQKAGLASLAFFYCDFREDRKTELRGLLTSFLVQLYHQSESYFYILSNFYSEHDKGSRPPSDDALARCLKDLLESPGLAPVYLIVDGLDECPKPSIVRSPRADVLSFIEKLYRTQIRNLRICITSRPEPDIKKVLNPLVFHSITLHNEGGQKKDIKDHIRSVINSRTVEARWKEWHRELAIDVLSEKSNGM